MRSLLMLLIVLNLSRATTVVELLGFLGETTLHNLILQTSLNSTLQEPGPFTLFAPSNLAFSQLSKNSLNALTNSTALLDSVLRYHVVRGTVRTADLAVNEKLLPTLNEKNLRVNYYMAKNHMVTIEGGTISSPDRLANNGVVHIIDKVLKPPDGTVIDVIQGDPTLNGTLMEAVLQAQLDAFLQDQSPITFFAPDENSWKALGTVAMQFLFNNTDILRKLLQYHVVPGTLYTAGFHQESLHTFEETDRITLHNFLFFDYNVDTSKFTAKDISATNGVVHKIGRVLIPDSIRSQIPTHAVTA